MIINRIKKISLWVIVLCFCSCPSVYIYAKKKTIVKINNATQHTVSVKFDWWGCGFFKINHLYRWRHHHKDKIKIKNNNTYSFSRGCISSAVSVTPEITGGDELRISIDNKKLTIFPVKNSKFSWMNGLKAGNQFTPILKYEKNNPNAVNGYFWARG
ncbi:MAG: hypothetical protein OXD32_00560, partial [Endozoicomonadaceae bacterium]|nr:hypothetical protein [Endozoicomonadaceae bacterium]MCY4330844.1 hypothetical protein [Endozoicomonadaceae bacterium]